MEIYYKGIPPFSLKEENTLEFYVRDTGIGIPEEKQRIIFESFRQADLNTSRKYGGTGLGLAITMKLIELMGGKLDLHSRVGEGSIAAFLYYYRSISCYFNKIFCHRVTM